MGGMKRHLMEISGMVKPDPEELKREEEARLLQAEFDVHCLIAKGTYRFQQYVDPKELLRSQLIASAGYAAFLKTKNTTAG